MIGSRMHLDSSFAASSSAIETSLLLWLDFDPFIKPRLPVKAVFLFPKIGEETLASDSALNLSPYESSLSSKSRVDDTTC